MAQLQPMATASHLCGSRATESARSRPCVPVREAGVEDSDAAVCAVHVQPEAFLTAELGEIIERVDRTGLHAAGVRRDQEGAVARPAVSSDRRPQVRQVHAEVVVDLTLRGAPSPSVKAAFSRQEWPSTDMYMVSRGSPGRPSARMSQPLTLAPQYRATSRQCRFASDPPPRRTPSLPSAGKADELHQPADDCLLHVYSRVITAGAARVGNRRGKCREHAQLGCGRIYERGETRMILAAAVWQHKTEKVFDDVLGGYSLGGNFHFLQLTPRFRRHGTVDRLLRKLVQVGGEGVHKPIAQDAEGRLVHPEGEGTAA